MHLKSALKRKIRQGNVDGMAIAKTVTDIYDQHLVLIKVWEEKKKGLMQATINKNPELNYALKLIETSRYFSEECNKALEYPKSIVGLDASDASRKISKNIVEVIELQKSKARRLDVSICSLKDEHDHYIERMRAFYSSIKRIEAKQDIALVAKSNYEKEVGIVKRANSYLRLAKLEQDIMDMSQQAIIESRGIMRSIWYVLPEDSKISLHVLKPRFIKTLKGFILRKVYQNITDLNRILSQPYLKPSYAFLRYCN